MKFDRDPQQLGFFLAHVFTYMQEYGHEIPTEGATARWMVTLHNANSLEFRNFNQFMTAPRFEDPLADYKARDRIKTVWQGCQLVTDYTKEFPDLACLLDWPEDILMSYFKDELNNDFYNACIARGGLRSPPQLLYAS